jgi:hypothetical protein
VLTATGCQINDALPTHLDKMYIPMASTCKGKGLGLIRNKEIKTVLSYQSTMMVMDIVHDINCDLLVDKTSIVMARVVSVLALSKTKIKIK